MKRIGTRISQKTGIAKSKNRSEDLKDLKTKYQQFAKNLYVMSSIIYNDLFDIQFDMCTREDGGIICVDIWGLGVSCL